MAAPPEGNGRLWWALQIAVRCIRIRSAELAIYVTGILARFGLGTMQAIHAIRPTIMARPWTPPPRRSSASTRSPDNWHTRPASRRIARRPHVAIWRQRVAVATGGIREPLAQVAQGCPGPSLYSRRAHRPHQPWRGPEGNPARCGATRCSVQLSAASAGVPADADGGKRRPGGGPPRMPPELCAADVPRTRAYPPGPKACFTNVRRTRSRSVGRIRAGHAL
jgi:hypothetical protein